MFIRVKYAKHYPCELKAAAWAVSTDLSQTWQGKSNNAGYHSAQDLIHILSSDELR